METQVEKVLKEANDYFRVVINGRKRANIFSSELLYNIGALALEKYLVAIVFLNNQLPVDHSIPGLLVQLRKLPMGPPDELRREISHAAGIRNLCKLMPEEEEIGFDDVERMTDVLQKIKRFTEEALAGYAAISI